MHTGFVTAITFFLEDFTGGMGTLIEKKTTTQIWFWEGKFKVKKSRTNNANILEIKKQVSDIFERDRIYITG